MIDVNKWTIEMMRTLFPDVWSPGVNEPAFWFFVAAVVCFVLAVVAAVRRWGEGWVAWWLVVCLVFVMSGSVIQHEHKERWRTETLPGRLADDPEAAVVVQNIRADLVWINKRAEERSKLRKAKKKEEVSENDD